MTKAILINGGNSIESRLTGVENYIAETLAAKGVQVETIQVHQLPAEDLIKANYASEAIAKEAAKFITPNDSITYRWRVQRLGLSWMLRRVSALIRCLRLLVRLRLLGFSRGIKGFLGTRAD